MNLLGIVYTTVGSKAAADTLANFIIEAKLAGCINIISSVSSIYWWEGKITRDEECIVLCKTKRPEQLVEFIEAHHPYELPAIIKIDSHTTQAFYDFISANSEH